MGTTNSDLAEQSVGGQMSIRPAPEGRHQSLVCQGVTAETVSMGSREPFESKYCGPLHLLIAHECLARRRGVTTVEGLPDSSLQNLSHTLTFVPAGRRFREWHDPDIPSRAIYIHIDPSAALLASERRGGELLEPRLHFQSPTLWQTILKLKSLLEAGATGCSRYGDALGVVLAHELVHADSQRPTIIRGGLAAWQRQRVAAYVEEHLARRIPVARLAELARLSPYHFSRSFKASFGVSPHRYHSNRRVDRAKLLLAEPHRSITQIALDVGFRETSSFTAVFRKLVGSTPSAYRRSLSHNMT